MVGQSLWTISMDNLYTPLAPSDNASGQSLIHYTNNLDNGYGHSLFRIIPRSDIRAGQDYCTAMLLALMYM